MAKIRCDANRCGSKATRLVSVGTRTAYMCSNCAGQSGFPVIRKLAKAGEDPNYGKM